MSRRLREILGVVAQRLRDIANQLLGVNPFAGDIRPARIPVFGAGLRRPTLPFPHPWNYKQPLQILESCFWEADAEGGDGRHTRYLDIPGMPPILISRDPRLIRSVATETGRQEGHFDRDRLLALGIARGVGNDMLLYANGTTWRRQRKLAAPPFGKTAIFQPEHFQDFEDSLRRTVRLRLNALRAHMQRTGAPARIQLEPEIKPVMLELLTNNFFGADVAYERIRNVYVPALERVIERMVSDTVITLGVPFRRLPPITRRITEARDDYARFEELVDRVLAGRPEGRGLWKYFKSDAPNDALRSNVRLILAGALEATSSYASWAISHMARNPVVQEKVFDEVKGVLAYTPESLGGAGYFCHALEETLRLTPPLYFLPRKATADKWIEVADGKTLMIPKAAYILLDIWHANRHEDHWGEEATGYPANVFAPERWQWLADHGRDTKEFLHFGFGHGPRVCPGKHLGQLEVGLVVGAFVKLFRFKAINSLNLASAGISTKPADGTLVELGLREDVSARADKAP
jgi:cytochrome P450